MKPRRDRPAIVCILPVKNEAWVLERCLECASLWADHIVVVDHNSQDGSRAVARRYPKVILADFQPAAYHEAERRALLVRLAREIPGPRIIFSLDADEVVSANWATSREWQQMLAAPPGTVVSFHWANLRPGLERCWVPATDMPLAYVDDGQEYKVGEMHFPRVPTPPGAPWLRIQDVRVLHYQYADWERMASKQRWYQCIERVHYPRKRAIALYRQFHHMDAVPAEQERDVDRAWFDGYAERGIDMATVNRPSRYWWDDVVLDLFAEHGTERFRRLDVWAPDWNALARDRGVVPPAPLDDPRTAFDRAVHQWLARTQHASRSYRVRAVQWALRGLGW